MDNVLRTPQYLARVSKEIRDLRANPPDGVHAWPRDEDALETVASTTLLTSMSGMWLDAVLLGPSLSPFSGGSFKLECCLPREYPFVPPHCRFVTPIYHPNIDANGRICVDILKSGNESGKWRPSHNVRVVLAVIRQLMSEPNPDDPLDADIASEYKTNRIQYDQKAKAETMKHASSSEVDYSNSSIAMPALPVPTSSNLSMGASSDLQHEKNELETTIAETAKRSAPSDAEEEDINSSHSMRKKPSLASYCQEVKPALVNTTNLSQKEFGVMSTDKLHSLHQKMPIHSLATNSSESVVAKDKVKASLDDFKEKQISFTPSLSSTISTHATLLCPNDTLQVSSAQQLTQDVVDIASKLTTPSLTFTRPKSIMRNTTLSGFPGASSGSSTSNSGFKLSSTFYSGRNIKRS